mmetsp:Transcript_30779/g.49467  ORF Transcript_30779/g.49467 Transcript_30779/m.49467 type:complete len:80 (-) Transcript_30779:2214-2453(-)
MCNFVILILSHLQLHSISETKEVSHTALRVLIREMEDQLQFNISTSKLKMRRAIIDDDKQEHVRLVTSYTKLQLKTLNT